MRQSHVGSSQLVFQLGFLVIVSVVARVEVPAQELRPDTVRGAVVVRNGPEGLWRPGEAWTMEELLRLGTVEGDGPTAFGGGQLSVALAASGGILVLDHQGNDIRMFTRSGEFVRRVGGAGQGPGEFDAPTGILVDHTGRMWVPEAFSGRYSIFTGEGDFLRTVPRSLRGYNRLRQLRFEGPESFIDHAAVGAAGFFRVDTTGAVTATFPAIPYPELPSSLAGPLRGPSDDPVRQAVAHLLPRMIWTLAPDLTLWYGRTDSLRLIHRSLDGDTLAIVETTHREGRFSDRERALATRAARQLGGTSPFVPQVMQSIHVLDDGHLLVQIAEEMGRGGRTYDVFDPAGRYLGSVEAPFAMPPKTVPALVGDTVVAVHADRLDVPYVVLAVILR